DHIRIADCIVGKSQLRSGWSFFDGRTEMSEPNWSFHHTKEHLEQLDAVNLIAQRRGRTKQDWLSPGRSSREPLTPRGDLLDISAKRGALEQGQCIGRDGQSGPGLTW